jgi:hypothetical protein
MIKYYIIVYVVSAFSGFGERKQTEIGGPKNCVNQMQMSFNNSDKLLFDSHIWQKKMTTATISFKTMTVFCNTTSFILVKPLRTFGSPQTNCVTSYPIQFNIHPELFNICTFSPPSVFKMEFRTPKFWGQDRPPVPSQKGTEKSLISQPDEQRYFELPSPPEMCFFFLF